MLFCDGIWNWINNKCDGLTIYLDKSIGIDYVNNKVQKTIIHRYAILTFILTSLFLFAVGRTVVLTLLYEPKSQVPKCIKGKLNLAIQKNCSFDEVKFIFDDEQRIYTHPLYPFEEDSLLYETGVDIIRVLNDMVKDYNESLVYDSLYIEKLRNFVQEAKEKYPFDKLTVTQKYLFDQLKSDAGDDYNKIENTVSAIVNEVYDKNEDINTYLSDATRGYILSIVALFASMIPIVLSLWKRCVNKFVLLSNPEVSVIDNISAESFLRTFYKCYAHYFIANTPETQQQLVLLREKYCTPNFLENFDESQKKRKDITGFPNFDLVIDNENFELTKFDFLEVSEISKYCFLITCGQVKSIVSVECIENKYRLSQIERR